MWRMFRAAIMGVFLGVVGGIAVGHISYVNNYKNSLTDKIASNAVMYNAGSGSEADGEEGKSEIGGVADDVSDDAADSASDGTVTSAAELSESDTEGIIRLQVRYRGEAVPETDRESLENYVGNCVMEQASYDASGISYADAWNNLVNKLNDINKYACEAGEEWGASLAASSRMSYEYFDEEGDYPAGYYNSLCITLGDKDNSLN